MKKDIKGNFVFVTGDITSKKDIFEAFEGHEIKGVIHVAGFGLAGTSNLPAFNQKTKEVLCTVINAKQGLGYADLPGRFPYKSSRGNEYLMVVYNYDANNIQVVALKNREAKILADGWETIHKRFEKAGIPPKKYISSIMNVPLISNKLLSVTMFLSNVTNHIYTGLMQRNAPFKRLRTI